MRKAPLYGSVCPGTESATVAHGPATTMGEPQAVILLVDGQARKVWAIDREAHPAMPAVLFCEPPKPECREPLVVSGGSDRAVDLLREAGFVVDDRRKRPADAIGAGTGDTNWGTI